MISKDKIIIGTINVSVNDPTWKETDSYHIIYSKEIKIYSLPKSDKNNIVSVKKSLSIKNNKQLQPENELNLSKSQKKRVKIGEGGMKHLNCIELLSTTNRNLRLNTKNTNKIRKFLII